MAEINLHKEYDSSGESVQDFFDGTGEGFFVPPYQREYTWQEDNINQLFDDLVSGVRELSEEGNATTFLGTIILATLHNKKEAIKPGEVRAQPTAIQIVIDGQQRIATLALLSIQITERLHSLLEKLPLNKPHYEDLYHIGQDYIRSLRKLHTVEIGKGAEPPEKPIIIRAPGDAWTHQGDDSAYASPVAKYIAVYIRNNDAQAALDALNLKAEIRVRRNIELIITWLGWICDAHIAVESGIHGQFPIGESITSPLIQEYILGFTSSEIENIVKNAQTDKEQIDYYATATYQLLLFTYYVLKHCGINRLQPTHVEWGFDMFQSLNATGTPLTAIETFVPLVMQAETTTGLDWSNAPSCADMDEILKLFEATNTNEQKGQRTNELLGSFSLCYSGEKLASKFSAQRKWITEAYQKQASTINKKREFVTKLSKVANFYYYAWHMEETTMSHHVHGLDEHPNGEFASFLIQYLKAAGSKLSASILARFYSQMLDESSTSNEFVESVKACAAFFTLWRSANSTSGLDNIYREYYTGRIAQPTVDGHNWKKHPETVSAKELKEYFLQVLQSKGIADEKAWMASSAPFLLYTELKTICRFMLFISGHNRIADSNRPGLTKRGTNNTCPLLKLSYWKAKDYKTLEHVAPRNRSASNNWDPKIYTNDLVHQVGNLILLPLEINSLADNKNWTIKYLYYSHVGEMDKAKLEKLAENACRKGIALKDNTTNVLSQAKYNCTMPPILAVGENGPWDEGIIKNRTQQIKELAWKTLFSWLQP